MFVAEFNGCGEQVKNIIVTVTAVLLYIWTMYICTVQTVRLGEFGDHNVELLGYWSIYSCHALHQVGHQGKSRLTKSEKLLLLTLLILQIAAKIILKVTPILLDFNRLWTIVLSHFLGLYHICFVFYGDFCLKDPEF